MPTDTQVSTLVINKLTKAQYDAATKSSTELYYVTDADGYADTDLSNLSATGEEKFDGSWVIGDIALQASEIDIAQGETKTYSLANYLDENKVYEVIIVVYGQTGSAVNNRCNLSVNGSLVCANRTSVSGTAVGMAASCTIPVTNRTISIANSGNAAGKLSYATVVAYRRVK